MISGANRRLACAAGALAIVLSSASCLAQAQPLEKLTIVIFSAPSLGAFMPPPARQKIRDQILEVLSLEGGRAE
jgi:hypothetical protein